MKSKNHQDPIQHLADRLREHAVPYREGAWEQFKAMEQKRKRPLVLLWPYLSAAAVMLLALTLFLLPKEDGKLPVEVAAVLEKQPEQDIAAPAPNVLGGAQGSVVQEKSEDHRMVSGSDMAAISSKTIRSPQPKIQEVFSAASPAETIVESNLLSAENVVQEKLASLSMGNQESAIYERTESFVEDPSEKLSASRNQEAKSVLPVEEKRASVDFLADLLKIEEQERAAQHASPTRQDRKWSVGLNVSPNMSANNQVNMGGGVALSYAVSPKISISSGLSYLQLDAERGVPNAGLYHSPISEDMGAVRINVQTKTLEKVQANLVGLDIPLTLNYHINDRFFTTVGVSVFGVLNERGSHQYLNQQAEVNYSSADAKTPEPVVNMFYSNEASSEKLYEGKNVSGFFNFSVGYSIPLSKKVGFAIEPFVKIPMGYISPEELNLSNGGIKISTRF